jgi:chromosomal replication initiator protein
MYPTLRGEIVLVDKSLDALWKTALDRIAAQEPSGRVPVLLSTCLPVGLEGRTLVLDPGNVFVQERIQSRWLAPLREILSEMDLADEVELRVASEAPESEKKRAEAIASTPAIHSTRIGLKPDYVFETFVVGKSNRLAHAASLAAAESPGIAYNPLFIWGGVGLGKTHLMHAIGHYVADNLRNAKVAYISSEAFTNELIVSIKNNKTHEFKAKYRTVDVLLIDDIQFIADKEMTQEEFFHTFNTLHDAKKQVVLSSDRPPKDIKGVEDRLVSRFAWGLVTDIQPPDLETRVAILQKKAELKSWTIPEEVLFFLAQNIGSNIRDLEGALNGVVHRSVMLGEPMTAENAAVWLKDVIQGSPRGQVSIDRIQQLVAESYGLTVGDLIGSKKTNDLALPRQIAMYLAREHTEASLQQIGTAFNKKDHTTVLHACRKIDEMTKTDPQFRAAVDNLRNKL